MSVEDLYGAGDLDKMFPGGTLIRSTPWPSMSRRKDIQDYDKSIVHKVLANPPDRLQSVDPRTLRATQPSITRGGVAYYLGRQWNDTGRTFKDQANPGNQYPVVYEREDGQNLLLSGHHRAGAALLKGEPLPARVVSGPWGPARPGRSS